jgi:hypothetical protein
MEAMTPNVETMSPNNFGMPTPMMRREDQLGTEREFLLTTHSVD